MSSELSIVDGFAARRLKIERQADGRLRTERICIPLDSVNSLCELHALRRNILDVLFVMINEFAAAVGLPPEQIYLCQYRDEANRENVLYLETAEPLPEVVKPKHPEAIDV